MRAVIVCLGVWFLVVSRAWAQFLTPFPTDGRAVIAYGDAGFQTREAERMMPFDATLAVGTSPDSFGSASQTSRVSQSEIFISGRTGDVLWESTNENAGAESTAVLVFGVGAPTEVRIRYELAIDTFSPGTWTGGASLLITGTNPPMLGFNAGPTSDGAMFFSPAGAFQVGADGYARTTFDEVVTFLPGPSYELRTRAGIRCPGPTATEICVVRPISFTTHLQVIPEPATWLAALLATIGLWCYWRFRSQLRHFGK